MPCARSWLTRPDTSTSLCSCAPWRGSRLWFWSRSSRSTSSTIGGKPSLVAVAVMVVIDYVVVGVAPRTLGRQHAARIALVTAPPVYRLATFLAPLTKLLILIGNALTPGKGFRDGPFASEAELRDLVDLAEERSLIEDDERQMIHSVFELGETLSREVMVPRTDMVFIERHKTLRQALSLGLRSGFSRIPVIGDNEDDVVGIVYLKDVAKRAFDHRDAEIDREGRVGDAGGLLRA